MGLLPAADGPRPRHWRALRLLTRGFVGELDRFSSLSRLPLPPPFPLGWKKSVAEINTSLISPGKKKSSCVLTIGFLSFLVLDLRRTRRLPPRPALHLDLHRAVRLDPGLRSGLLLHLPGQIRVVE